MIERIVQPGKSTNMAKKREPINKEVAFCDERQTGAWLKYAILFGRTAYRQLIQ